MVWVWKDSKGHWTGTPPKPDNYAEGLVMVFPGENWAAWLDYLGAAGSEHFNYRTWHSRLQTNMARIGITGDLYRVNYSNCFDHEQLATALWRHQPAENIDHRLTEVLDEAELNHVDDMLSLVVEETREIPNALHGREDIEKVVWNHRKRAIRWMKRRACEYTYVGSARVFTGAMFGKWRAGGFPWRVGDNEWSQKMWGEMGRQVWLNPIYDSRIGLAETKDDFYMAPDVESDFRRSSVMSRRLNLHYASGKKPGKHTKKERASWVEEWLWGAKQFAPALQKKQMQKIATLVVEGKPIEEVLNAIPEIDGKEEVIEWTMEVYLAYHDRSLD